MNSTLINQTTNETIKTIFGHTIPLTGNPTLDIFLVALVASLFVTLINKYFTDQVKIKALRKEMKDLQKELRKHVGKDHKKAQEIQSKIMQKNLENMKYAMNFKVMLITMFPMLILFYFIKMYYSHLGEFFTVPIFGWHFGWLGTYITFSIINSILLKKILDVA